MEIDNRIIYQLAEEQLADGVAVKLRFGGTSMWPTLRESDTLTLVPLQDEPAVGDVLFFHHMGRRVVHRLIKHEGSTYLLQGDNNYGTEQVGRADLLARLSAVERRNGRTIPTDSPRWRCISRWSLVRKGIKNFAIRWLGRDGRHRLRPWYFGLLVFLMWAPLNGVGIPLDNYILGLRADHLLHASVYLPCALFLKDLFARRWALTAWLCAVGIGLLTEGVQYLLPYRGFDINDLIANTLGITLGWVAFLLVRRRLKHQ
ncbi:MAG: VanZ family protein [Bacteroidales bacterium]|nr:VanZ family protein [Bacteroidales bacterium]